MDAYFLGRLKSNVPDWIAEVKRMKVLFGRRICHELSPAFGPSRWKLAVLDYFKLNGATEDEIVKLKGMYYEDFAVALFDLIYYNQEDFWEWIVQQE